MSYAIRITDLSGAEHYVMNMRGPEGITRYATRADAETEARKWPSFYGAAVVNYPQEETTS